MNDKIKLIREECIAANPEIVELKFGCEVEYEGLKGFICGGYVIRRNDGDYSHHFVLFQGEVQPRDIQIVGAGWNILSRPIRLADVLLATSYDGTFWREGDFIAFDFDGSTENKKRQGKIERRIIWNLRADDLEQQSEETVTFLAELLK